MFAYGGFEYLKPLHMCEVGLHILEPPANMGKQMYDGPATYVNVGLKLANPSHIAQRRFN